MELNEERLEQLLVSAVTDFGATWHTPLIVIGDRLGLYEALEEIGPATSQELADQADVSERYVREWLAAHAARGYIDYDADTQRFQLSPEQAALFADEDSPAFVVGAFQSALGTLQSADELTERFASGEGFGWHEHDHRVFVGTERLFRPAYLANLVDEWIPALDGVEAKLRAGAQVADIGCGYGASTTIMAQAYPDSEFVGFDSHEGSIRTARQRAEEAGVADRTHFTSATAKNFDGGPFDFVTAFDCLHDMGDPAGAAAHIREQLDGDGTWMIVEPFANDRLEENLNPVSRAFYAVSTLVCTPCSLEQEVGRALGAQAGEEGIGEVVSEGGFEGFRRAAETPFNLIFEARP